MNWNILSDIIKKKISRYLLERYLGRFVKDGISLAQLELDILKGTGKIYDLLLSPEALTELCDELGLGIEVTYGSIGSVTVSCPLNALLSKDSSIELSDVFITIRPKPHVADGTSMFESMWSSMSNSMQLAQECMEKEPIPDGNRIEGLECFAQVIDDVLKRVKAKLDNTTIRIEFLPPGSDCGIALIVKVDSIDYNNEPVKDTESEGKEKNQKKKHPNHKPLPSGNYDAHNMFMEGVSFYTEEFRIQRPDEAQENLDSSDEQFYNTLSDFPDVTRAGNFGMHTDFLSHVNDCDSSRNSNSYKQNIGPNTFATEYEDDLQQIGSGEILAGRLIGQQDIRVRLKHSDELDGPKVDFEINLDNFQLFLSPRQLQSIILMVDAFVGSNEIPVQSKNSPVDLNHLVQRREEADFEFKHNVSSMAGGLGMNQGWSLADPMQAAAQEQAEFLRNDFREEEMISEPAASSSSSMISSFATSNSGSRATCINKKRTINPNVDADISSFSVHISGIAFVLLHEELLVESSQITTNESPLSRTSVENLKFKAERFFRSVSNLVIGSSERDILNAGIIMDSGCDNSRLRLIMESISLTGEEQRNQQGFVLTFFASVGKADLCEVLPDISIPLVKFSYEKHPSVASSEHNEILMSFRQTCSALKNSRGLCFAPPQTEIRFSLESFVTEFDITILDRLNSLLYQSPFAAYFAQNTPTYSLASPTKSTVSRRKEPKTEIYFDSPSIDFRLRFPIPDLRPIHDPQRVPWWRRNVRPDYLLLKLQQARVIIRPSPHPLYDISANSIELFYHESELKTDGVNMGKAVMTDNLGRMFSFSGNKSKQEQSGVEYPRIIIELPSDAAIQKLLDQEKVEDDDDNASGEMFSIQPGKTQEETPFSAKRMCTQSDTPHVKSSDGNPEEHILPGDTNDLRIFCGAAMKQSRIQVKFDLPVVSLQLRSKHLYEIIYNRITTDLLLWEASAPAATGASANPFQEPPVDLSKAAMTDSIYTSFKMCQSGLQLDSSSSVTNSESESDSDAIYYTVHERSNKHCQNDSDGSIDGHSKCNTSAHPQQRKGKKTASVDRSNAVAFQLNIGQGILTMFAPVRDSQNHVIPGQLGEFVVKLQSTYVFSVNGFHGNKNLGYLCILGKAAEIYHCGLIPTPVNNPPLRLVSSVLPSYLCSTLYGTPRNLTLHEQRGCPEREMFSLVIEIKTVPEKNAKNVQIAAGVQLTTLRHHTTLPQHSWLTQLRDMFDVVDYPVSGYKPPTVATEMSFHLWDCAIDYRPLYFPYRVVISIGTNMISSSMTIDNAGINLKFITEDAAVCLAPHNVLPLDVKHEKEHRSRSSSFNYPSDDNKVTALPSNELVCLVEVGLFEISLQLHEKATTSTPKFDLRATITDTHLRTCADSGQAFAQLMSYLAAEGDLFSQDDGASSIGDDESSAGLSFGHEHEEELLPLRRVSHAPEVTAKQQQLVNTTLAEAIEESYPVQNVASDSFRDNQLQPDGLGADVFLFPDENQGGVTPRKKIVNNLVSDNSHKRRFVSDDDSLSMDEGSSVPSSYQDDDHYLKQRMFDKSLEDVSSTNTEMRDLLNFESSVMGLQEEKDEVMEALPQVTADLGDVSRIGYPSSSAIIADDNSQHNISSDTDDDFCFIVDEELPHGGNQEVPLGETPLQIVENHFSSPVEKTDLLAAPKGFPTPITRYTICNMSVAWHMYGGHDFFINEDKKNPKAKKSHAEHGFTRLPMTGTYKCGVSYTKNESVTFGHSQRQSLPWKHRGGRARRHDIMMEIQINKVKFSHEVYPANTEQASRQVLVIPEFEIWDRLAVSNIKKFLYHWSSSQGPKKGNNNMIVIKALHLRPNPLLVAQECCLRISVLPIRLNIDQDSLFFMINFFNQLCDASDLNEPADNNRQIVCRPSSSAHQAPIMMVELPDMVQEIQARKIVSDNLELLIEEEEKRNSEQPETYGVGNDDAPIYFRNVTFSPAVMIRIDYQGKRVELSHGPLAGLIMGLGTLQCSEIRLKQICYKQGILGAERLYNFLLHEWLHDIRKNQLQKILSGVGPVHSLVQFVLGILDLFILPYEQYQLDGRIVWGLKRGAHSFTCKTMYAALDIGLKLIKLIQITAETAFDMVSAGPSVRRGRGIKKGKRKRLHPPQDIREGVNNAFQIVKEGITETAHNLVELTAQEHDQKGYTGAVGAVIRQLPPIVVQPIVLASQATTNVLGGVKNQLVPDARAEAREKYKDDVE